MELFQSRRAWRPRGSGHLLLGMATFALLTLSVAGLAPRPSPPGAAPTGAPGFLATPGGVIWSYPGQGRVFRSPDGGRNWRQVLYNSGLSASYFLGPDDAWAIDQVEHADGRGETTTVYRSVDGGATWQRSRPLPGDVTTFVVLFDQLLFAGSQRARVSTAPRTQKSGGPRTAVTAGLLPPCPRRRRGGGCGTSWKEAAPTSGRRTLSARGPQARSSCPWQWAAPRSSSSAPTTRAAPGRWPGPSTDPPLVANDVGRLQAH